MTEFELSRMMMRHKKQLFIERDLNSATQKEFEKEVMATVLACISRAFDCLRDLKSNDELLGMMDDLLIVFDKGDKYMIERE